MSVSVLNPQTMETPAHWSELRPWHTNLALGLIGFAMICFTRQMISEHDHFTIGYSGASSSHLVLYFAAVLVFLIKPSNVDRFTFPIILGFAIAARLAALFAPPFLSSDVYRYAWDGVVQHAHINPYRYVPGDAALSFLRAPHSDLYEHMNRRDYAHTIYPPVAQLFFYVITFLSPSVTFMKMAMVLFEGLTMYGLILLLREFGIRREWTIVYAWSPLLIWEIGGSGHVDSMIMAFLTFAILFRYRRKPVLTGAFLCLAVLTKFYPLVLFPAFYQRGDWKMPTTFACLAALFYLPYLSAGKLVLGFLGGYVQEEGISSGQRYFLLDWTQHVPGFAKLPSAAFLIFAVAVFVSLGVWAWRTSCRMDSSRASFIPPANGFAIALMLLFSPHYPWYLAWLIPFVVLAPSLTAVTYISALFYLCTTALAVGYGPKQYHLNILLYSAVAVAFVVELTLRRLPQSRSWFRRLHIEVPPTRPVHPLRIL